MEKGEQLVADDENSSESVSELDENAYIIEGEEVNQDQLLTKIKTGRFGGKGNKMAGYGVNSQNRIKIRTNREVEKKNIPLEEGEDWGVEMPEIRVPESGKLVFMNEAEDRRIVYSSNECVLSNSNWREFHQSIKGEYKDVDFDFSVTDPVKRRAKHIKPIIGLGKDLSPGMK